MGVRHREGVARDKTSIRRATHAAGLLFEDSIVTSAPTKINHVGLAVPDIEAFLRKTTLLYEGFSRGPMIVNERQKVRQLFVTDGATSVELLEPFRENSPLQAFLNRNPAGGLIHLAFEVIDLDATIARMTATGGRLVVAPVPDVAFHERRIAFVYYGGQINELIELPR
jgi:methylmalonyl-CoA/ethylmalonyl-CoA epimerase